MVRLNLRSSSLISVTHTSTSQPVPLLGNGLKQSAKCQTRSSVTSGIFVLAHLLSVSSNTETSGINVLAHLLSVSSNTETSGIFVLAHLLSVSSSTETSGIFVLAHLRSVLDIRCLRILRGVEGGVVFVLQGPCQRRLHSLKVYRTLDEKLK